MIEYIPNKKHYIVVNGFPTSGPIVWEEGDYYISKYNDLSVYVSYKKSLKIKKKKNAYEINPNDTYDIKRKKEYPNMNDLIIALWEHIVESKSKDESGISEIENIRQSVKKRYPKNEK